MVWIPAMRLFTNISQLMLVLLTVFTVQTIADAQLNDNRQPALYTESFGSCNVASEIDVTRFNVALYLDNTTVIFQMQGNSLVTGMKTMMFLSVYAYGEERFSKIFDPCFSSINSLCPSNISKPIEVDGFIPLAPSDIENIPSIAYAIPDFEGQAVLRIFDNDTQAEVACYSAMITNGNTMSWPASVGGTMGFVISLALVASFLSSVYGEDISTTRTHYAHSMSIFVVFATLQHVYFTGALSMNWASVLPAFWSNFAWAGGMIYSTSMQTSINSFSGNNFGNTSFVGAAGVGDADNTAGGYDLSDIYRRDLPNATQGFYWYGNQVSAGLPVPGNFTGFPGTLSFQNIPASNAFLTGFLWQLILIVILVAALACLKGALELFIRLQWLGQQRLQLFRRYWIGFTAMVAARTCFVAFFSIMFLALFQFAYGGYAGTQAITALVWIIFLICVAGITTLSVYYRLRDAKRVQDRLHLEVRKAWKIIPYLAFKSQKSRESEHKLTASLFSIPWISFDTSVTDHEKDVHHDEPYIRRYGWLVSRYRKTRWWFAAVWLIYEFVRAIFFGAAAGHPSVQVFGLLVVEFIGLIAMIKLKPFESTRLNVLMIYLLGLSKVVTVALSSAFHPQFGLPRIVATGIAFVIIVIQGLLLVVMMILVVIGLFSTFFSLSRNRETLPNENWTELRTKFFTSIDRKAFDQKSKAVVHQPLELTPTASHDFNVNKVRRMTMTGGIEDTDSQNFDPYGSRISVIGHDTQPSPRTTRANSVYSDLSYANLPYGARPVRASWGGDQSPVGQRSRRASHSYSIHTLGSEPALRNGYGVVPKNRASSYGSGINSNRRSRSSTCRSTVPVSENEIEGEPPLPKEAVEMIARTVQNDEHSSDGEIVASPLEITPAASSKLEQKEASPPSPTPYAV